MKLRIKKISLKNPNASKSVEKRTLESTIAGLILFVLTFAQSIILVPVFLKFWGTEKYGVWITLYAFINLMRTLDLGHQNYVGNEFNKLFHTNKDEAKKAIGSGVRIAYLLGFIELSVYLLVLLSGIHKQVTGIALEEYPIAPGLLSMLFVWMAVGSVSGILVRMIMALGRYSRSIYLNMISKVFEILAMLACAYYNTSINMLCYVLTIVSLLYTLLLFYDIKKQMPEFYPWWQTGSWKQGFAALSKSIILTVNNFIEQFNNMGLILLISKMLGPLLVPVFTTIRTISNTVVQATSLVLTPLSPEITRYYATNDHNKISKVVDTNWFISGLLVNLPFVILTPFVSYLYAIWTKGKLPFDPQLFFSLTLSVSVINFGRSYLTLLTGINALKSLLLLTISRFVLFFGIGYVCVQWQGLAGIGLAILFAEIISSVILPYLLFHKKIDAASTFGTVQIMALLQTVLLAAYFTVYRQTSINPILLLVIFTAGIFAISAKQWTMLDTEVKSRLLKLVKLKKDQ